MWWRGILFCVIFVSNLTVMDTAEVHMSREKEATQSKYLQPKQVQKELERKDNILYHFDKLDAERLNKMVQRHKSGKGDYLMLIPPIIDGGYWIHDVHSNGREITWTIDNTRDVMSSERGKQVYRCKNISMYETNEHYVYTLDQCNNEGEKSLPILRILKENDLFRSRTR